MTESFFHNNFLNNNDKTYDIKIKISRLSKHVINLNPVPIFINENISCFNLINLNLKKFISEKFDSSLIKIEKAFETRSPEFLSVDQDSAANINYIMKNRNNKYINILHYEVINGVKDILKTVYSFNGDFRLVYCKTTCLTYDNFTFLNTHRHFDREYEFQDNQRKLNIIGVYYIDDGDPDDTNKYCGCISLLTNNKTFHIRPKNGTLILFEGNLQHLVNPFISRSDKKRQVITMNICVFF